MKRLFLSFCLVELCALVLISCSPVIHSNVGYNAPMFEKEGEVSINPSYSISSGNETADGFGFQGGYALTNKIALITSFYNLGQRGDVENQDWFGNGSYVEFGSGFYGRSQNNKIAYEVLGGVGFGSIKNKNYNGQEFLTVSSSKPFIQPSLGFVSKYFEITFIPRIAYVTLKDKDLLINDVDLLSRLRVQIEKNNNQLVFEPGFQMRFGFENVKIQLQYSFSTFNSNLNSDQVDLSNNQYLAFGLNFRIKGENEHQLINHK